MVPSASFWQGKKVFITGHTGFKGSWLSLWLHSLGAKLTGFALEPPTEPSLYKLAKVEKLIVSNIGDIRDLTTLKKALCEASPSIVIHLAAQPLVRESYKSPVETYSTNIMGTVNLMEVVRGCPSVKGVINVTSDKCYENKAWCWGYRENEPMGGFEPYSSSKGCAELVTAAYRNSFFNPLEYEQHGVALASARAGNVIGGGDWAADRLVCDCIRALLKGDTVMIRSPKAIRPWQFVLEPLGGYLLLAQKLFEEGTEYAEGWNFGPRDDDAQPVLWLVQKLCEKWGKEASYKIDAGDHPHEENYLKLDCSKAGDRLGWKPKWSLEMALESIVEWTLSFREGKNLQAECLTQIDAYTR